jgi:hypothetical protein
MKRIKVTGYLNPNDMDPDHVDLDHSSGLTQEGDEAVTSSFSDQGYKISDLEDIETELVDE